MYDGHTTAKERKATVVPIGPRCQVAELGLMPLENFISRHGVFVRYFYLNQCTLAIKSFYCPSIAPIVGLSTSMLLFPSFYRLHTITVWSQAACVNDGRSMAEPSSLTVRPTPLDRQFRGFPPFLISV